MKRTFRIMGLCALAALALAGCKKDEQKMTSSLTAKLTQPTSDSKTHFGPDRWLRWNENDAIKVFDAEGTAYSFTTTDNDSLVATFNGETEIDANAAYTAFYPETNATDQTEGYVYLTLPASQTYADGTFASNTYPMLATNGGSGTDFTFRSPCGVLAIPMKGAATIGSIVLTDKNNAPLAGQMKINPDGLDPTNPTYDFVNTTNSITLNCGGLTLAADTAKTCVFVVPAGVFANGFTAVIKDMGDNEIYTLATVNANTIVKESILTMPVVTIQDLAVTTGTPTATSEATATLNGSYVAPTGISVTEVGFYWGPGADLTNKATVTTGTSSPFSFNLSGLSEGQLYSCQAYAMNGSVEKRGTVQTFTTQAYSYGVYTGTAVQSATDQFSYTLNGSFSETLSKKASHVGFYYGTDTTSLTKEEQDMPTTGNTFSTSITVASGTTYYYKAYLENNGSEVYGSWQTLTTSHTINLSTLTAPYVAQDGDTLTGTLAGNYKITVADGATVTLLNATITYTNSSSNDYAGITCLGNATLVIVGTNTVQPAYNNWPAIHVATSHTLTINGEGTLNANNSNSPSSAIGAGPGHACGNIVIESGTINATGGQGAAIGAGQSAQGTCGNITISGGNITATSQGGAGIGGGQANAGCGAISISNCTVNATGNYGAGIGGGAGNSSANGITISNSNITATSQSGAGIGSGQGSSPCGNITINNSTVNATSQNNAGIGSCGGSPCGNINITGGDVTATGNPCNIGAVSGGTCGNITITDCTVVASNTNAVTGIGGVGGYGQQCGDITIIGSDVTALAQNVGIGAYNGTGSGQVCGNISISNSTVTAQGTQANYGVGIGISQGGTIGTITIANDVQLTAIKGTGAVNCIGKGTTSTSAHFGTVTIGGTEYPTGVDTNVDDVTYVYPFLTPEVTTGNVTAIIAANDPCAATGHVTMTVAGTASATEIGLCWGTSSQPTVGSSNYAVAAGQTVGTEYTVNMTGLASGTRYYVRGYAKVGNNYYYASNEKTVRTVFLINNLSDWNAFAAVVNGGESTVYAFQKANISGVTTVVGNSESHPFKGTYNGQGYAISNVSIHGGTHVGLFGVVNSASAVIENVVVASGSVSGTGQNVGAVVGQVNSGTVRYCANYAHVSSSYNGNARVGGIVGWLRSAGGTNNHLEYCINYGAVNGQSYVGGVVGSLGGGYVQYCQNYATITATSTTAAGIIGWSTENYDYYTHNHNGGNIVASAGYTIATKRYFISNQSGDGNLNSSNTFLNTMTVTLSGNVYTYTSSQISGYVKGATPVSSNPAGITIGGTTYGPTTPAP